ncbi:MAG: SnoaL-like domain-containing protein [Saccharothrix sp.]|nr:SnoaL-like domain-containing protein [Saccharothrix sp.]
MTDPTRPAEANKSLFLDAFARFAAGDPDVLRTVLHEDFVEHSPGNPSGRDAFVEFVKASRLMGARFDLKRVIADEEHVVVHYHLVDREGGRDEAVVDIWRIADGLIVEHWDVVQPVPEEAEVPHGMF